MANPQHIEWLLEGVEAWNARREQQDFVPDFEGADLRKVFEDAGKLDEQGRVRLENANLRDAKLGGAKLWEAYLSGADLSQATIERADFRDANLEGAKLEAAGSGNEGADFTGANLMGANLGGGAYLSQSNFRQTALTGASLRDAYLAQADLERANLGGADLRGANLEGANLGWANVLTFVLIDTGTNDGVVPNYTDLSNTRNLTQNQLESMVGDTGTILPDHLTRPAHWPDWRDQIEDSEASSQKQMSLPSSLVDASAYDFDFTDEGIVARTPTGQEIDQTRLEPNCINQFRALIENARHIAANISNKLGEGTTTDLTAYADHLEQSDSANPHRLAFLAGGIEADLSDSLVTAGFDNRLSFQLKNFLALHQAFLDECLPEAAKAIQTKKNTTLNRTVTKQEATAVLDKLDAAIAKAEAATDSLSAALRQMRANDNELNALSLKVFSEEEHTKLRHAIERETVENAATLGRLYDRAKQVAGQVRRSGHDAAAVGTLTGMNAVEMARVIATYLEPVIRTLREWIAVLPPV